MLQGRLTYGGALSGRDQNAATKTVTGLLKLIHPSPEDPVPEADLEWAIRLALECRRRVKEQQKRIGTAEFRNFIAVGMFDFQVKADAELAERAIRHHQKRQRPWRA